MSFKPTFNSNIQSESVPWANEYIESHPTHENQVWDVTYIKLKPKGLIIECNDWCGWYFKSTQQYKQIVVYLEAWVESGQECSRMQLMLIGKKPFFLVGEESEEVGRWLLQENSTFYQAGPMFIAKQNEDELNLSLPTPLVPSTKRSMFRTEPEGDINHTNGKENSQIAPASKAKKGD